MNNKQAYQALLDANLHWGRTDENHIYVWTPGYKTQDCSNVEAFLNQFLMQAVSQEFDKVCGKTRTIYKHK